MWLAVDSLPNCPSVHKIEELIICERACANAIGVDQRVCACVRVCVYACARVCVCAYCHDRDVQHARKDDGDAAKEGHRPLLGVGVGVGVVVVVVVMMMMTMMLMLLLIMMLLLLMKRERLGHTHTHNQHTLTPVRCFPGRRTSPRRAH